MTEVDVSRLRPESDWIRSWFRAALDRVEPGAAVQRFLRRDGRDLLVDGRRLPVRGRVYVVAVGKAAVGMALGAEGVLGQLPFEGIAITKDGHATGPRPARVRVYEAGHPIPDERGVRATQAVLEMIGKAGKEDVVLALISGGGSALLEAPRPPVTLQDLATTTDLLLRAGAPITHLNAVRIPLSLVKGGGLRRAARQAGFATLLLSDVLGNDPAVIASGPTVPSHFTRDGAIGLLDRYGLCERVPRSVVSALTEPEVESAGSLDPDDAVVVVGDNAAAVEAVHAAGESDGYSVSQIWAAREGEAADLGRAWVEECRSAVAGVDVMLGGGEATVTVRGDGVGGRNTEFALAAAMELAEAGDDGWVIASLATDGQDGPTGVAGAIADWGTVGRAAAHGVDAGAALANNDSLRVFEAVGGLVDTGPTGTNVNDLFIAVRRR
jgi:glycerate 2-kinase